MQLWRPEFKLDDKSRQLVPLLTNKDISLTVRGRLYSKVKKGKLFPWSV